MGCPIFNTINDDEDILLTTPIKPNRKTLNNGLNCPIIGLGTALIKTEDDANIVYQSILDGVRLIDLEPANEEIVGKGIYKALTEKKVKRKDLFIVTKLELKEKNDPKKALINSLKRLQLEYVDLYLDYWPSCTNYNEPKEKREKPIPVRDTWKKMEALVDMGLTKSIGVCNYNVENLLNIISICRIKMNKYLKTNN